MLLRLFKGTGFGVIILIIIVLCSMWAGTIIKPVTVPVSLNQSNPMPLYGILLHFIGNNNSIFHLLPFLLVCLISFLLVNFNTVVFFINERTFLPALIYALFSGILPEYQILNPALPASLFLMLALMRIMGAYHKTGPANNFFDAGLLISIGSMFYANLIWFGVLVLIAILSIRNGNLKEIFTSLIGLVTPYLILYSVYYILGKNLPELTQLSLSNLFDRTQLVSFTRLTIVTLIYLAVLILVSFINLLQKMGTKKIKSRKAFSLIIWTLLITLAVYFSVPSSSAEMIWLFSIPASYLLTHYFVYAKKKFLPELLFSLIFLFICLIQFLHLR
jgi:hypothetical protein